jgi:hypothetical protein
MSVSTIDRVLNHAKRIRDGKHDTIKPGMPQRLPDSWVDGDAGAQGDLVIVVVDEIPAGYKPVRRAKDADRQLVPGNTEGAKHCLDSLDGVELYRLDDWGPDSLDGPCVRLSKERVIQHPTHGPWTIPAGRTVKIEYARERDALLKRERRNAD